MVHQLQVSTINEEFYHVLATLELSSVFSRDCLSIFFAAQN